MNIEGMKKTGNNVDFALVYGIIRMLEDIF